MTNCPFIFTDTIQDKKISFNYSFDTINNINTIKHSNIQSGSLSISQTPKIPAIKLIFTGYNARSNISINLNSKVKTYGLQCGYITNTFPVIQKKDNKYSYNRRCYLWWNLYL